MPNPFAAFGDDVTDEETPKTKTNNNNNVNNVNNKTNKKKKKKAATIIQQEQSTPPVEEVPEGFKLVPKKPPRPKKDTSAKPKGPVQLVVDVNFVSSHPLYDFHLLSTIILNCDALLEFQVITLVCHNWYSAANSHLFWRPKVTKKGYGTPEQKQFILNSDISKQGLYWKQMYKEWYLDELRKNYKREHLDGTMIYEPKDMRRRHKIWDYEGGAASVMR